LAGPLHAQPRTDVVTLANGDRITGEVKRLDRGQVEFKTDDGGTIYFEWSAVRGRHDRWPPLPGQPRHR
jgi:hypothetical protein